MIASMFDNGSMPLLERVVQFTAARHKLIAGNIANVDTPNYRPKSVSVDSFQQALGEAADRRRARSEVGAPHGELPLRETREVRFGRESLSLKPLEDDRNMLFHDRNNRSFEHLMQDLASNASAHNRAIRLLKNQFNMLETVIRERV